MSFPRSFRLLLRARWLPPARVLTGLGVAFMVLTVTTARPAGGQDSGYQPPVTGPITDPFRAPEQAFGAGNRGIEYDTEPGAEVAASGAGEVVFAGLVAGSLHVSVLHDDGVRTSYSFLDTVDVLVGQQVLQGERLGTAGELLHFGARRGDAYFDPASLFDRDGRVEVELLPFEVAPGDTEDEELAALLQTAFDGGDGLGLPGFGEMADWVADRARLVQYYASELAPQRRLGQLAWDVSTRLAFPEPCSDELPPGYPASRGDRVAVLVGGLGSSSESASIDGLRTQELGYDPAETMRFSYAGGRTPVSGSDFESLPVTTYASVDTQGDLQASAVRLADAIEAVLQERSQATLDLYAHSMGGVVARLALLELGRRGADLARLGLTVTFGSPHQGADLATTVEAAGATLAGRQGMDLLSELTDMGLDPNATAIQQLSETSDVIDALADGGVPEGVELVSIAAAGDVIVAAPNTRVAGAENVTTGGTGPTAHGDLVESDEATDAVARALAGMPQRCEDPWEIMGEELLGHGISYIEDLGGFTVLRSGI